MNQKSTQKYLQLQDMCFFFILFLFLLQIFQVFQQVYHHKIIFTLQQAKVRCPLPVLIWLMGLVDPQLDPLDPRVPQLLVGAVPEVHRRPLLPLWGLLQDPNIQGKTSLFYFSRIMCKFIHTKGQIKSEWIYEIIN